MKEGGGALKWLESVVAYYTINIHTGNMFFFFFSFFALTTDELTWPPFPLPPSPPSPSFSACTYLSSYCTPPPIHYIHPSPPPPISYCFRLCSMGYFFLSTFSYQKKDVVLLIEDWLVGWLAWSRYKYRYR